MRRVVALSLLFVIACSRPAVAWDPYDDMLDAGTVDHRPDPAPFVVPDGLYRVTDVYAGDVVTRSGDTTTYTTTTVSDTPGTFARVVDVVGTGDGSTFDGASFNGRARVGDGRSVAGTYYEDFVLTSDGFVSVNVVFFQDDSETQHRGTAPVPTAAPPTPGPLATVVTTGGPSATYTPAAAPTPGASAPPAEKREPIARHSLSAGIALGQTAPVLERIEVLRGRTVHLYPRVLVDGVPVGIRSWRLVSGVVSGGSCAASGTTPACDATWTVLAPPGQTWTLRFELAADALPGQTLIASIDIAVRSPALEQ